MSTTIPPSTPSPPTIMTPASLPGVTSQATSRKLPPHRKFARKFLTLPDELLTIISDAIDPKDLPNFRLTCKTLNDVSGRFFGEKRLAHRRFLFTEYSMKGLVDLTAHPVFGPCVKSIMFSTHHLSNSMRTLMDTVRSKGITNDVEAMQTLRMIVDRYNKHRTFVHSTALTSMLQAAFTNLASLGTSVSLGFFDDVQRVYRGPKMLHGFGFTDAYQDLPFIKLSPSYKSARQSIRSAYRATNFRVASIMADLHGQEDHNGMEEGLSALLLSHRRLQNIDTWIKLGPVDIGILATQSRLEFKQTAALDGWLGVAEDCRFELTSLGGSMRNAMFAWPFTTLHMSSCSMYTYDLLGILQILGNSLRVVELFDVAFWVHEKSNPDQEVSDVLRCLRDDLQLHELTMDNMTAFNEEYVLGGIVIVKGRSWHGQEGIRRPLSVLIDHGMYAWDEDLPKGEHEGEEDGENGEEGVEYQEHETKDGLAGESEYESGDVHASFSGALGSHDAWARREKALTKMAKEAMARAEAENAASVLNELG